MNYNQNHNNNQKSMLSVLFVCTGNICRSPTAEAVFRKKINSLIKEYSGRIDSAGIEGYHAGEPPDARAVKTARMFGVDMKNIRARKFKSSDYDEFDYIIAMDNGHIKALEAIPQNLISRRACIRPLLDFHNSFAGQNVPDPYYGSANDFEQTYKLIDVGVDAFIEKIFKKSIK